MVTVDLLLQEMARTRELSRRFDIPQDTYTQPAIWREYQGTWLLYPRQSGKTTALIDLAELLRPGEDSSLDVSLKGYSVIVTPNRTMEQFIRSQVSSEIRVLSSDNLRGLYQIDKADHYLLMDEFLFINESKMNILLEQPWKSVLGIGSMK